MREKEKTRVIWRHPQGRFEIQETEHYSPYDNCIYRTRGLLPDPVPRVTDEEVREMARLFASGMSVREVAKATKRNMRTVREHLRETRAIR